MKVSKKRLGWLLIVATLTIAGGELFARYYLGLGTPPLSVADPKIEYMFKPDQDVYRFKNHFITNHYGMRSSPFPQEREGHELRIMVFGDSVLNGGNLTDHTDLATSILQKNLSELTANNVVVGNISAGSWGPGNWLAYANKYGFFDSDIVVLVISSHDYADNPTFQPLNPNTHPTGRPFSALTEGITRYLPRYLPHYTSSEDTNETDHFADPPREEVAKGLEDLKKFLVMAKNSAKFVLVFQHWERDEINKGEAKPGNARIHDLCESIGIIPIQLNPYFQTSIKSEKNPYRDNIHPNQTGQKLMAKAILENLLKNAIQG
jgi:lysophospholipase L1-like esterase